MTNPRFHLRLTGTFNGVEVHPHTFDVDALIALLKGLIEAVRSELPDEPGTAASSKALLFLASVEDKCDLLGIGYSPKARHGVLNIERALIDRDFRHIRLTTQKTLRRTFNKLFNFGTSVQYIGNSESAVYGLDNPLPELYEPAMITEETSLLAKIEKIGGKNKTSILATFHATGQTMTAECPKAIAKKLSDAGCLYESVSLEGQAKWQVDNWKLVKFKVRDFVMHKKENASKIFDELAKTLGESWEGVDSKKFVDDIRGGQE